eukprot:4557998-Pyramimonas_sp.AAC.1
MPSTCAGHRSERAMVRGSHQLARVRHALCSEKMRMCSRVLFGAFAAQVPGGRWACSLDAQEELCFSGRFLHPGWGTSSWPRLAVARNDLV